MNNNTPTYPQEVVQPFRDELTAVGFKELLTPADVDAALNRQDDKVFISRIEFCLWMRCR